MCLNLKQVSLAAHNYYTAPRRLSPRAAAGAESITSGRCFSAYAYLLPNLDRGSIYNATNFNLKSLTTPPMPNTAGETFLQPENTTCLFTPRTSPVLLCPSDIFVPRAGQQRRNPTITR